jgi:hypothetical protein
MLAVLLAEFGGRASQFARLPHLAFAATLLGLAVGIAAVAGISMAPTMNAHARALLLGIALIASGLNQFGKATSGDPPATLFKTFIFVWRSGAPFLAFAFAIWKSAPVGAAAGALAGVVAVVALALVPIPDQILRWIRRVAGGTVIVIGIYAALWALQLIR